MAYTAVIWNKLQIGWPGIIIALSVLSAYLLACALRSAQGRPLLPVTLLALLSAALSLPLCRFLHWYSNPAQYASLAGAMTDYAQGGYAPLGAVLGVLLSALLLRLLKVIRDLPGMLDCCAPAGALALGLGRLACLYSTANRSKFSLAGEAYRRLPFMVSSTMASGELEWRGATFFWEALAALAVCLLLLILFYPVRRRPRQEEAWQEGNIFLLFILLAGCLFIVLDSTRYDANYFRANGFVSITQVFCGLGLLIVLVLCSARSIRADGLRPWHWAAWALWAAGLGVAGYMEYYVQRHGDRFLFAYSVMLAGLLLSAVVSCLLLRSTVAKRGQHVSAPRRAARAAD